MGRRGVSSGGLLHDSAAGQFPIPRPRLLGRRAMGRIEGRPDDRPVAPVLADLALHPGVSRRPGGPPLRHLQVAAPGHAEALRGRHRGAQSHLARNPRFAHSKLHRNRPQPRSGGEDMGGGGRLGPGARRHGQDRGTRRARSRPAGSSGDFGPCISNRGTSQRRWRRWPWRSRPRDRCALPSISRAGRRPISPEVEDNLLRIAQEAVANASRHAGATHVGVNLSLSRSEVALTVEDDGRGFDPAAVALRRRGIRPAGHPRAGWEDQGHRRPRTAPGEGTRLVVRVPLWGSSHPERTGSMAAVFRISYHSAAHLFTIPKP